MIRAAPASDCLGKVSTARASLYTLEQFGIKLGLEQIRALVDTLGHPDRAYPSIVIAGTNGKGSVTAMLERGLRAAGYRTGRYTSPHLVHLEERFAVDGMNVGTPMLDDVIERVLNAAQHLPAPPSFFEATTAAALDLFRSERVDVALLEVGLGGRLDATNVVAPVAVAITAVDFDHQQYLGDTLAAIATEKAAIIKTGSVAVLGPNPNVVDSIVADRCREMGADLVRASDGVDVSAQWDAGQITLHLETPSHRYVSLRLALRGRHQIDNAMTAIRLLEELSARRLFNVPPDAIRLAVEDVTWPGRLEVFHAGGQEVLIDGAHNAAGARALVDYLRETYGRLVPMIVGVMRDKDVTAVVSTLASAASHIVCTAAASPRAMAPPELAATLRSCSPEVVVEVAATPREALDRMTGQGSPIVVAGSLYLAGEVRAELS